MKKSWDKYFLDIAEAVATRSPDPSTQVGCVIINKNKRVVSTGYNGFIQGCDEKLMSLERPLKYFLIIHAELNSMSHAEESLEGCAIYVTQAPCENCLKHILNHKIKTVIFRRHDVVDRFSDLQKQALTLILQSMPKCIVKNESGETYLSILEKISKESKPENHFL